MISNKIVNRITIVSKDSQENISEAVTNNHDKEIPKEKYAPPEERQEIINELRLKYYNNEISENSQQNNSENDRNT